MNYYLEYKDKLKKYPEEATAEELIEFITNIPPAHTHYSIPTLNYELINLPFENTELFKNEDFKQAWFKFFYNRPFGTPAASYFDKLNEYIINHAPNTIDILKLFLDNSSSTPIVSGMPFMQSYSDKLYSIIDTAIYAGDDKLLCFITDYLCKYQNSSSAIYDVDHLYVMLSLYKRGLYNSTDKIFHTIYNADKDELIQKFNSYHCQWDFCNEMPTLHKMLQHYFPHNADLIFIKMCFQTMHQWFVNNEEQLHEVIIDKLCELDAKTPCLNDILSVIMQSHNPALKEKALTLLDDEPFLYIQDINFHSLKNQSLFETLNRISNLTLNIDNYPASNSLFYPIGYSISPLCTLKTTKALIKNRRLVHTKSLIDNNYIIACLDNPKIFSFVINALDINEKDLDDLVTLCLEKKNMTALNIVKNAYSDKLAI